MHHRNLYQHHHSTTPRERGWRAAPAWMSPGRFWLAWPGVSGDRARDEAARQDCLGLASLLAEQAPVSLVCANGDVADVALKTPPGVAVLAADHDGSPMGEHAPLWLVDEDGRPAAALAHSSLGRTLAEQAGLPLVEPPSGFPTTISCDGEGTVLVAVDGGDVETQDWMVRHWLGGNASCGWHRPAPASWRLGWWRWRPIRAITASWPTPSMRVAAN